MLTYGMGNRYRAGETISSQTTQKAESVEERNPVYQVQATTSGQSPASRISVAAGRSQQYLLHEQLLERSAYDQAMLDRFSLAGGLFSGAANRNSLSKRQLNHLAREREKFGRMLAMSMQGGRNSPLEGMSKWAQVVYDYVRQNPSLPQDMIPYEATRIYRAAVIKVPDEQKCSIAHYLDTLEAIDQTSYAIGSAGGNDIGRRVRVLSQSQIDMPLQHGHSPRTLYETNPNLALGESFFLVSTPIRATGSKETGMSRVVINPHPGYMPLLAQAMAFVVSREDEIRDGKVGAHNWLGNRSDDAMLHLCSPNVMYAQSVIEALKEEIRKANRGEIPEDMFLSVQPPGTEFIDTGIYYAETAPGRNSSVATDRGEIVAKAVVQSRDDFSSLSTNLRNACLESGYDPNNPARILNSNTYVATDGNPQHAAT